VNRRAVVLGLGALATTAGAGLLVARRSKQGHADEKAGRLVSLAPAITETIVALNAAGQLVAVSDFCQLPSNLRLPRVGSALTPAFETIARLQPRLVLCDDSAGSKRRELAALAPTEILPWLTLHEATGSMKRLGQIVGQELAGNALSQRISLRLSRKPPVDAPRALLLLSYDPDRPAELWFIRQNSLHGAALMAAGCWNAVSHDVGGLPKLGAEELIRLDPDLVLMIPPPGASTSQKQRMLRAFHEFSPLSAVKNDRLGVVNGTPAVGPSILQFTDALAELVHRLAGPRPAGGIVQ